MPLHYEHWQLENPKAVVAIVHGLGEYCGKYAWTARRLNEAGYAVLGADLPGHGTTPGPRGHIARFDDLQDAFKEIVTTAEQHYPQLPVVLLGHSMGGLVIIRAIQTTGLPASVRAVFLISPALKTADGLTPPPLLRAALRVLSRTFPKWYQGHGMDPDLITRSHGARTEYAVSELILHKVTTRLLDEFLHAQDLAMAATGTTLNVPLLIAQAGQDLLVSSHATSHFFDKLDCGQKSFRLYEPCYHELLSEPERNEILDDFLKWLHSCNL